MATLAAHYVFSLMVINLRIEFLQASSRQFEAVFFVASKDLF